MKIIDLQQNTSEWHTLRRKSIGASDCSVIMGNNPGKDEYTLFQEKMGLHSQVENEAMRKGKELEPIALAKLNEESKVEFKPCVIQSSERSWQIASLDGYHPETGMVEIKCSLKLYSQAQQGIIPQMYIDQMQHQLCVTGLPMCYYYAFWQDNGVTIEVKRDDVYIANLVEKESIFYERMVKFDPPEPKHKEMTQSDWLYEADIYQRLCKQESEVKKLKEASKQRLIEIGGGNAKGAGISLTKVIRPGVVNYNAYFDQLGEVDLEPFRSEPIEYWVVTKDKK